MAGKLCVASITLAVFVVATAQAHAQEIAEDEVKTAVRAAWDAYIVAFSAARTDVVARDVYAAPSFQLGARGAKRPDDDSGYESRLRCDPPVTGDRALRPIGDRRRRDLRPQ